jgi:hypothetical protein
MTNDDVIYRHRLRILALAGECGSVSQEVRRIVESLERGETAVRCLCCGQAGLRHRPFLVRPTVDVARPWC